MGAACSVRQVVLIVEDEPMLLIAASDVVEEAGFDVEVAIDADEAVRILESRTDIRIVFTDIDMPGSLDGMKLAACIRDRWPPIDILITSGQKTPALADLPARAVFLPKPYRSADVKRILCEMVAG